MHELARHIIHSTEILAAAVKTLQRMAEEHGRFYQYEETKGIGSDSVKAKGTHARSVLRVPRGDLTRRVSSDIDFHAAFLQNIQLRSKAFEERLNNEIKLVCTLTLSHSLYLTCYRLSTALLPTIAKRQ